MSTWVLRFQSDVRGVVFGDHAGRRYVNEKDVVESDYYILRGEKKIRCTLPPMIGAGIRVEGHGLRIKDVTIQDDCYIVQVSDPDLRLCFLGERGLDHPQFVAIGLLKEVIAQGGMITLMNWEVQVQHSPVLRA